jgi:dTDP-4-dehydrorhamnose 3,5-epimerase
VCWRGLLVLNFTKQSIPDILVIEPKILGDERGYFAETFRQDKLEIALGYKINFIQDNESNSSKGVLRGLHFQIPPHTQSKLVRVTKGSVLDVAVDIRKGSPYFGSYVAVELSSDNHKQMFIPQGFAHGFLVLSETATFAYKVDEYYSAKSERGLRFNDFDINIDWSLPSNELALSKKDLNQPKLRDLENYFIYN